MSPAALEKEDHTRDAQFNRAMHGNSAAAAGGVTSMLSKDKAAQKAAVDEYFKHWDGKAAEVETEETRAARKAEYATLTRQYVLQPPRLDINKQTATTTWPPTSTSTAGAARSTSAASPTVSPSGRPSPATSTTSPTSWASPPI